MKKISIIAMLLALLALLCACTPKIVSNGDTTSDTTIPVTSPDGFEDVTAPPEKDTTDANEDTTEKVEADTTDGETTAISVVYNVDTAIEAARNWLGDIDPDTGYKYAFSYDGIFTEGDNESFKIRVSWYIAEQERYSLCGYLLVTPKGEVSKYSW